MLRIFLYLAAFVLFFMAWLGYACIRMTKVAGTDFEE